jgi:hypothetical protein
LCFASARCRGLTGACQFSGLGSNHPFTIPSLDCYVNRYLVK